MKSVAQYISYYCESQTKAVRDICLDVGGVKGCGSQSVRNCIGILTLGLECSCSVGIQHCSEFGRSKIALSQSFAVQVYSSIVSFLLLRSALKNQLVCTHRFYIPQTLNCIVTLSSNSKATSNLKRIGAHCSPENWRYVVCPIFQDMQQGI